jgi:hypothetical protein
MGILDAIMNTSSEISVDEANKIFKSVLFNTEEIQKAYQVVRDTFVFTNKRLIIMDKQGFTGKKTEFLSIPYKSITFYSVETAGHFDLDAELKIFISGQSAPIKKQFNKKVNVYHIQSLLSEYVCK